MVAVSVPGDVLQAARAGDSVAFERLVSPYRNELLAHCYRMLGSRQDAEDALQEALIRAWRSVGGLDDRGFVRAWLYKIATNRCLSAQLETSTASVSSALQRARKVVDTVDIGQQGALRALDPQAVNEIAERWMSAWPAGDVDAIVAMLADDARYSMPPVAEWYVGRDAIRTFLLAGPLRSRWRFLPTSANGQLAFGTYLWDDAANAYLPGGLDVLTIRETRVSEIVAFRSAVLTDFGLPARLPG
jgi:RNA polymerase sigma-70 factor (ECF subfamily)